MRRSSSRLLVAATAFVALSAVAVSLGREQNAGALPVPNPPQAALVPAWLGQPPVFASTPAPATLRLKDPLAVKPGAGMLIDLSTGRVMWQSNASKVVPIASLTKMMNALVSVRSASPERLVMIRKTDTTIGGSVVGGMPAGKSMPVEDLLAGMLVVSGNDAALALADGLGPGRARFTMRMNALARQMGLSCTHFNTPTGLSKGDRSCASDVAKMAAAVLAEPRLARIVRKAWDSIKLPGQAKPVRLRNRNPLLQSNYPGIDGVKTGHTAAAGYCLAASVAREGGQRLLGVLLHSPDTGAQMRHLFDLGLKAMAHPASGTSPQ